MKELIHGFIAQLEEAIEIGEKASLNKAENEVRNVLISGLGGSGIGGTIVSELAADESPVPISVNKDYFIPKYVDENTLVIISSYSGNTEETLNAFKMAQQRKAKIVCISSNGKVLETAREKKLDFIQIPGGKPPRACLGYSFTQLLYVLDFFGIISNRCKDDLKQAIDLLKAETHNIEEEAEKIAGQLHGKLPIIYSASGYEGVAVRFRQQLNENAKILCWHHVIPEMNHNELVGWRDKNEQLAVVIFRNDNDYNRTQKRMEINKEVISQYTPHIIELWSEGTTRIEKSMYLIHLGDWISYHLAIKRGKDPVEVEVIDFLKGELAKFG